MKRRTLLLTLALTPTAFAQEKPLPTVYLIGDSTVKNNTKGQQGWGSVLAPHVDSRKAQVVNRALGGRSSRTFLTEGLWEKVRAELKPGDFVLMQFGHNDNGDKFKGTRPRASIKGNGEETETGVVEATGKEETVHSYGWYLRQFIADTQAKGATPIVCSLVPRNIWKDGKVGRATSDYTAWAKAAATQGKAHFIDLNAIIADRYDALGEEKVTPLFFGDHTHTSPDGAQVNAACVVEGIRSLTTCPLKDLLLPPPIRQTFVPGHTPTTLALPLPEGNWRVSVTLGHPADPSETTVRAEARRVMLEGVKTEAGQFVTRQFVVSVRRPAFPGGTVKLKPREVGPPLQPSWDDQLTLSFSGPRPHVSAVEVQRADDALTVFLTGDSTVTDQTGEPFSAWGQWLPKFFDATVAVANHAESGESLRSSRGAKRFAKVLSQLRPGDYVFIQFGHNDQKEKGAGIGAFTSYKTDLKAWVAELRAHGGLPVLVTPMYRRRFDAAGKLTDTLGDYPEAVRQVAKEEGVPLIDLHALSKPLFEGLGVEGSKKAFVHTETIHDDTHFSDFGAKALAEAVVAALKTAVPELAKRLQ